MNNIFPPLNFKNHIRLQVYQKVSVLVKIMSTKIEPQIGQSPQWPSCGCIPTIGGGGGNVVGEDYHTNSEVVEDDEKEVPEFREEAGEKEWGKWNGNELALASKDFDWNLDEEIESPSNKIRLKLL